ncbi:MAG: AAA family ATPase [Proteobacteria bacterium]|nr:AAA family ATPase [Pseudomonadota bacterium]
MDSISVVTVSDKELEAHLAEATRKVLSFPFRPPRSKKEEHPPKKQATLRGRTIAYRPLQGMTDTPTAQVETQFSLADRIQELAAGDELYSDVEHHVLRLIRRAVQVYARIYETTEQASGLDRLKAANQAGTLSRSDEPELAAKVNAASAAALFAFASYLLSRLLDYGEKPGAEAPFQVDVPSSLPVSGRSEALHAGLHLVYTAIDTHARDDQTLVQAVREAAAQLALRLQTLQHSLQYREFFTRYHYRVEPEEVLIAGFELPVGRARSDIHVPEKRPEEIVGNHVAKLEASRIAQRLVCYDLERQRNPFVDLGGFVFTFLGDGSPGTGKTILIQMMVTLLRQYAEVAGLPLRYENFSIDEISDYQGRSGQNAKRFCQSILDPRVVALGTIDDVDQVCGSRHDKNASAGQLEVTAVFMQEFAGTNTVVRGNASFGLLSNHPERVDDALRQRTQIRFQIDGPQTRNDFADLFHILLHRTWDLPPGKGYEPLSDQRVRQVIREKYGEHDVPQSPTLRAIFEEVTARGSRDGRLHTWSGFGEYLHALQQKDPRFTGRAVKNVSDAILSRMMDFDLPDEWLEKRESFFAKPYETRVAMVSELRSEITPEMVIQEINRYADSESRYAEASDQREFDERTRQYRLDARARKTAAESES